MSRIANAFKNKAKVAYLTAGDSKNSVEYFKALVNAKVNVLEIGVPFSDPVADGSVIQMAMKIAIENGTNLEKVLEITKQIREFNEDVAIILFTYLNPIVNDLEGFILQAKKSGVDGVLVVDMPFEESIGFRVLCKKHNLAAIAVAAPSTSIERVKLLTNHSDGFLYYACRSGTTGVKNSLPEDLVTRIKEIKKNCKLPVAVGFGVSNNEMVRDILEIADGAVIGSYLVQAVANNISVADFEIMANEVFNVK
jgi:tryptophan synthase alpha chain